MSSPQNPYGEPSPDAGDQQHRGRGPEQQPSPWAAPGPYPAAGQPPQGTGTQPYPHQPYGGPAGYGHPEAPGPHSPYGPPGAHGAQGAYGSQHYGPQPYGAQGPHSPQHYGWQPQPPRRRQQDSEPGRFTWWDLGATLFYVIGFLTGLVGLIGLVPAVGDMLNSADEDTAQFGMFLINGISYAVLAVIALALSGSALWRSIRRFGYLWWLKLLLVPVGWAVMLGVNILVVVGILGADPETSENQAAIDAMLGAVPFLGAVLVIAVLGPYVEEYFFRHLLIGKLSRHLNIWVCGAISVVTFPLLHFIPALIGLAEDLTAVAVVPYVTMGALITVGYILSGRNLFYAWLIHAFNNFISLVMAYFVQPWAEGILEDYPELDAGLSLLPHVAALLW